MGSLLKKFAAQEQCSRKLALASSVAVYVAFSPFFGLHTLMHVVCGWFFGLNIPLLLVVGYTVNNPWTMIPIYMSGYFLGYWLLHSCLGFSISSVNPWWMESVNTRLHYYLGFVDVSFWAFMVGANILGIILAFISYPFFKVFFRRLIEKSCC